MKIDIGSHTLFHGDCLDVMATLDDHSIDVVIADLPYAITKNRWDSLIDLDALWSAYWRILKPVSAVVLTASQPFTSKLVMSAEKQFKHEWIWIKNRGSNFANTVREPMKEHESVLVFSKGKWTYNKQMQERTGGGKSRVNYGFNFKTETENYNAFEGKKDASLPEMRVPSSWQKFNTEVGLHPTQKPVNLMRYLARTYSNPGDTILDNTMGSGSTGVGTHLEGRRFIGIERDDTHYATAVKRMQETVGDGLVVFK